MLRMGAADSCYYPVLTHPMAGVSHPLGLTCLSLVPVPCPRGSSGLQCFAFVHEGHLYPHPNQDILVDACKPEVWESHALWGKRDLCLDLDSGAPRLRQVAKPE